jgi:hypothetical protein
MTNEREVLQNHNELRSRAVEYIRRLAKVADERNATFTLNNILMPRANISWIQPDASRKMNSRLPWWVNSAEGRAL